MLDVPLPVCYFHLYQRLISFKLLSMWIAYFAMQDSVFFSFGFWGFFLNELLMFLGQYINCHSMKSIFCLDSS